MNETQLLKQQCELEARGLREIAQLCARTLPLSRRSDGANYIEFIRCCAHYLQYIGDRCEARDADHEAHLRAGAAEAERADLERHRTALLLRRQALAALADALARTDESFSQATTETLSHYCALLAQSGIEESTALAAVAARRYTIEDWRAIARVDADSIREERRLRAEVLRLSDALRGEPRGL
jgi:hypothetical protein